MQEGLFLFTYRKSEFRNVRLVSSNIDSQEGGDPIAAFLLHRSGSGRQMGLDLGRYLTDRGLGLGVSQDAV
jgi:hypothetical protein